LEWGGPVKIKGQHLKALEITGTVLMIVLLAVTAISMHTLVVSFMGSFQGEGEQAPFTVETTQDPAGGVNVRFSMLVRNDGMLEARMRLNVRVLSLGREVIAEGENSKVLSPGSYDTLTVSLSVSAEEARRYLSDSDQPQISMLFECRTFFDLIGMGIQVEV